MIGILLTISLIGPLIFLVSGKSLKPRGASYLFHGFFAICLLVVLGSMVGLFGILKSGDADPMGAIIGIGVTILVFGLIGSLNYSVGKKLKESSLESFKDHSFFVPFFYILLFFNFFCALFIFVGALNLIFLLLFLILGVLALLIAFVLIFGTLGLIFLTGNGGVLGVMKEIVFLPLQFFQMEKNILELVGKEGPEVVLISVLLIFFLNIFLGIYLLIGATKLKST